MEKNKIEEQQITSNVVSSSDTTVQTPSETTDNNQNDVSSEMQTGFAQTEPNDTIYKNWDYYTNVQNIHPYTSKGGKRFTASTTKQFKKRNTKNKTQRMSRRINRKK